MATDDVQIAANEARLAAERGVDVTADTITDKQIRELFARHCKCRPLDVDRASHSHDCDTGITETCLAALGGQPLWPDCMRAARACCAEILNARTKGP
jgi:hypothetical protein